MHHAEMYTPPQVTTPNSAGATTHETGRATQIKNSPLYRQAEAINEKLTDIISRLITTVPAPNFDSVIKMKLNVFLRDVQLLHKGLEDVLKESDASYALNVTQLSADIAGLKQELVDKDAMLNELRERVRLWDEMLESSEIANQLMQAKFL
eukprot:TRINITY_DN14699_c0_g1_i1.p1 TRINITY_DN14699_c0_g1~~TRINITY_DN14699_c0_g1_i1.p1  ORF type:complete len:175 (-),score=40.78 TRINITY_DN14699_c0_g1_i1:13-465(-)